MAYFLIDFENVKSDGMTGVTKLSAEDKVCIFYSEKADSLSFGMHKQLNETLAEVNYRKVEVGTRNALDFQLATYLGFLVANTLAEGGSNECFYVVSKDTGYVSLENYWKKNQKAKSAGIEVKRVASIAAAVKLKKAVTETEILQSEKKITAAELSEKSDPDSLNQEKADPQTSAKNDAAGTEQKKQILTEEVPSDSMTNTDLNQKEKPKKKKKSKSQGIAEKEKAVEKKKKQIKKRKPEKEDHEDRMINEKLLGERIIGMHPEERETVKPHPEETAVQEERNPEIVKKAEKEVADRDKKRKSRAVVRKAKFKMKPDRSGKKTDRQEKHFHKKPEDQSTQPEQTAEKPSAPEPATDGFSMVVQEQNFVTSAPADFSKYHVEEDFSQVTEQTHVANYHPGQDTFKMEIVTKGAGNQTIDQKQIELSEQDQGN